MHEPNSMLSQMEKLIRKNVVMHFANKTAELGKNPRQRVKPFAVKQLDFFIKPKLMKNNPGLQRGWKNGHPFTAKAAINKETMDFEILIVEREPGKW